MSSRELGAEAARMPQHKFCIRSFDHKQAAFNTVKIPFRVISSPFLSHVAPYKTRVAFVQYKVAPYIIALIVHP